MSVDVQNMKASAYQNRTPLRAGGPLPTVIESIWCQDWGPFPSAVCWLLCWLWLSQRAAYSVGGIITFTPLSHLRYSTYISSTATALHQILRNSIRPLPIFSEYSVHTSCHQASETRGRRDPCRLMSVALVLVDSELWLAGWLILRLF